MNNKEVLKYILEIYNITNTKFKKYLNHTNTTINETTNEIIINTDNDKEVFNYEYAGYYDNDSKNWYWAWILPNTISAEDSINNKILNYGLSLNNQDIQSLEYLYKLSFINPIINLKNNIELDNHVALILSVLRNRVQFIYKNKVYLDSSKKKYIINYYYILN